jgi:hypothetical protein
MFCNFLGNYMFIPNDCVATLQEDMGIPTTCKIYVSYVVICIVKYAKSLSTCFTPFDSWNGSQNFDSCVCVPYH